MSTLSSRPASSPGPSAASSASPSRQRTGVAPWLLLVATDAAAVATLARCFRGPGEIALLVPVCILSHLLAGGARRLPLRGISHGAVVTAGFVLALFVGFALPLAAIDPGKTIAGFPLGSADWHALHVQLSAAWSIFSKQIAPVAEAPGLVIVSGWAAAIVAVAAEVLYADVGLPAILSLVPAFDVVVFSGTLGTATGRSFELVGIAALSLAFLVMAQSDHASRRVVVMARVGAVGEAAPAPARSAAWRKAVPGVTVVAALAAGVLGPALPGATSNPLVAWHGVAAGRTSPNGIDTGRAGKPNTIQVSGLVQVAEEEIERTTTLLLTVHSAVPTREVLLTLDRFNGDQWTRSPTQQGQSFAVPILQGSLDHLEASPPPVIHLPNGGIEVTQVMEVSALGGEWLPSPGTTISASGDGNVSELGAGGPIVATAPLTGELVFGVKAQLSPTSPAVLANEVDSPTLLDSRALRPDRELPGPIPSDIVSLEHEINPVQASPYVMAERIQQFFLSGHGFTYQLPRVSTSGAIANTSANYAALQAFLFRQRVGYCQQYATAFAVLARIAGLPTRIAVGFLPGKSLGHDAYAVSGTDVHAWPQVYLGAAGWVSFEPTPGVAPDGTTAVSSTTSTTLAHGGSIPTTTVHVRGVVPHNLGRAAKTGKAAKGGHRSPTRSPSGSSGLNDILLAIVAAALLWLAGVPLARILRRQRARRDVRRATLQAWASALSLLAVAGAHRRRSETHGEFAVRVRNLGILSDSATAALVVLAHRMDKLYYAAHLPDLEEGRAALVESRIVCRAARRRVAWWQQLMLLLDPRDLVSTGRAVPLA